MQRPRISGTTILSQLSVSQLKRKSRNSLAAAQDTFFSIKDVFERHRVVFTVGTSIASVATAWAGYSLRHYHDTRVDKRLESIEYAMKNSHHIEDDDFKKVVDSSKQSTAACLASAGTALVIGYGLGWRGGRWYANRKLRREQMKMMGQVKPKRWQLLGQIKPKGFQFQFLKRTAQRSKSPENASRASEKAQRGTPLMHKESQTC